MYELVTPIPANIKYVLGIPVYPHLNNLWYSANFTRQAYVHTVMVCPGQWYHMNAQFWHRNVDIIFVCAVWHVFYNLFPYRSNHSGNNGSSGSLPSSAGPSLNSDDINNGDHLLNNNTVDNGITEVCDVPDDVANQKRHVSTIYFLISRTPYYSR